MWEAEQQEIINILKIKLTSALLIKILNILKRYLTIFLGVNGSKNRWGLVVMQNSPDEKKRCVIRYDSGL